MSAVDLETKTILIAGASRGLGLSLVDAFAGRGWNVIATKRDPVERDRGEHRRSHGGSVETAQLDVTDRGSIASLAEELRERRLDVLFINAGTTTRDENVSFSQVKTSEFEHVLATNTLGPMRVIEALQHLVPPDGLIGAMSSGQGSITNNNSGGRNIYRASKAALNMSMKGFTALEKAPARAILLLAPGWIRTDLGGDQATYSVEESAPKLADVIISKRSRPGLEYLDRDGNSVAW